MQGWSAGGGGGAWVNDVQGGGGWGAWVMRRAGCVSEGSTSNNLHTFNLSIIEGALGEHSGRGSGMHRGDRWEGGNGGGGGGGGGRVGLAARGHVLMAWIMLRRGAWGLQERSELWAARGCHTLRTALYTMSIRLQYSFCESNNWRLVSWKALRDLMPSGRYLFILFLRTQSQMSQMKNRSSEKSHKDHMTNITQMASSKAYTIYKVAIRSAD